MGLKGVALNLSEISVRRPVMTVMVYLGLTLFGMISLMKLPQALYPQITFPQLTVMTYYGNAAPEEVETLITKIIEEAVGTVSDLKRVTSKSKEGMSLVTAEFSWGTDMNFAALSMREKIDLVKARLPRDSGEPIVLKFNPLELPAVILSLTGERGDVEMLRYARRFIKEALEKLEGVASCSISGGVDREIHVDIDQAKMMASSISIDEVTDALTDDNLNYPAGTIKENFYEYLIRSIGEYTSVEEIGQMPLYLDDRDEIKRNRERGSEYLRDNVNQDVAGGLGKRLIYLSDIAKVTDTKKERHSYSRYNGVSNISLSVQKQATANVIDVAERVKKELKVIKETMPEDMAVEVIYDQSIFVKQAIRGVATAIWQGGLIAFFILLYFLKNIRSALVVGVSIPVSVVIAFGLMYGFGVSINMMSLSGLALGIGMMVDNAIVVMENISRLRTEGKRSNEASIEGSNEVGLAVFASTLTTVAVFFPMVFVVGIAGQMFKDLSLTVVFSLMASLLVALTLIPRLSSGEKEVKRSEEYQPRWVTVLEYPFYVISRVYGVMIRLFLKTRLLGLPLIVVTFVGSIFLMMTLNKEMLPKVDQGEFVVKVTMPAGTLLKVTNKIVYKIENYLLERSDVESISIQVGSDQEDTSSAEAVDGLEAHEGELTVKLKANRKQKTKVIVSEIRDHLKFEDLDVAQINIIQSDSSLAGFGGGEGGAPIIIEVKGTRLDKLRQIADALKAKMESIPGIVSVKDDFAQPSPEIKVTINKDRAALHGLSVIDISQTAQVALRGSVATKYKEEGKEVDVVVRLREEDRKDFGQLRNINIRSKTLKQNIPLREVAYLTRGLGPSEIVRKDQQRVITVSADIFGHSLDQVILELQGVLDRMKIPNQYSFELSGESEKMKNSFQSLQFALILSIILVYMIMASQFESLWQPIIIMLTVPLSLIGVSLTLFATRTSLNVMVILGIIMLSGIVVNNAIVLISTANDLRIMGETAYDAIVHACKLRLRPILMTTLTTVLGLIPLALELSEGSEVQAPMAKTVMGGLGMATFLTLFVIPALYLMSENMMDSLFKRERLVITEEGKARLS